MELYQDVLLCVSVFFVQYNVRMSADSFSLPNSTRLCGCTTFCVSVLQLLTFGGLLGQAFISKVAVNICEQALCVLFLSLLGKHLGGGLLGHMVKCMFHFTRKCQTMIPAACETSGHSTSSLTPEALTFHHSGGSISS